MSVLVVNQGIENQHTAKLLVELVAQGLVIIKAGFQRRLAENTPDRDERGINIRDAVEGIVLKESMKELDFRQA